MMQKMGLFFGLLVLGYISSNFSSVFLSAHAQVAQVIDNQVRDHPAVLILTGDWTVQVEYKVENGGKTTEVVIPGAEIVAVKGEKYDSLPMFNFDGPTWNRGLNFRQVLSSESPVFSVANATDGESVVVRSGTGPDAIVYEKEKDYTFEPLWISIGRLPDGRITENQPVFIDYVYGKMRLDSVVLTKDQKIILRKGIPDVIHPIPPDVADGEKRLANIWVHGRIEKLSPELLFPILETDFPESEKPDADVMSTRFPKTMQKLRNGEKLRVLAWGDSVTDAGYLPQPERDRWQEQFVKRLRERFPKATVELVTEAWGGRNSDTYRNEPPGSPKNYREKVLNLQPDLVVSEFVNDAGMQGDYLSDRYSGILKDFREIGAEWIILTPHYVRPDWMGLDREKNIDDDPRQYTWDVRKFAESNGVAIADGAKRYGRLWRQGIPYSTLMMNNINHPNPVGMKIFADALMDIFPEK